MAHFCAVLEAGGGLSTLSARSGVREGEVWEVSNGLLAPSHATPGQESSQNHEGYSGTLRTYTRDQRLRGSQAGSSKVFRTI